MVIMLCFALVYSLINSTCHFLYKGIMDVFLRYASIFLMKKENLLLMITEKGIYGIYENSIVLYLKLIKPIQLSPCCFVVSFSTPILSSFIMKGIY